MSERKFRIYFHLVEEVEREGESPELREILAFNSRKIMDADLVWRLGTEIGQGLTLHINAAMREKDFPT